MRPSDKTIDRFRKLYEEKYEETITVEDARERIASLLLLVRTVTAIEQRESRLRDSASEVYSGAQSKKQ